MVYLGSGRRGTVGEWDESGKRRRPAQGVLLSRFLLQTPAGSGFVEEAMEYTCSAQGQGQYTFSNLHAPVLPFSFC